MTSQALGGLHSAHRLRVYLCGACHAAIEGVGSIGPTAMTRALRAHLDAPSHLGEMCGGLKGWAAPGDAATPCVEPWSHVDTSAFTDAVGAA